MGRRATGPAYVGVWWDSSVGRWTASIYDPGPPKRMVRIARFDHPEEAAIAVDRVILHTHGSTAKRNFPRRALVPASIEMIRRERRSDAKRGCTSHFVGVY